MRLFALIAAAALSACASTGATPQPFPRRNPSPETPRAPESPAPISSPAPASPASAGGIGYALAGTALALRGSPYRDGGDDPGGFDCSGFVRYVFGQHGVAVPRNVDELFRAGTRVRPDDLQPGDLVFFDTQGVRPSHVGIAIGGDSFVHAPSMRGVVRVDRIGASYWAARFLGARRLI